MAVNTNATRILNWLKEIMYGKTDICDRGVFYQNFDPATNIWTTRDLTLTEYIDSPLTNDALWQYVLSTDPAVRFD